MHEKICNLNGFMLIIKSQFYHENESQVWFKQCQNVVTQQSLNSYYS